MTGKTIIMAVVALVVLAGLGVGGYFVVKKVDKVHKENMSSLEGFGSVVTPGSSASDAGPDANGKGLAPSISVKKISATDKIIISLSKEKEELVSELNKAQKQIADLQQQVADLTEYKNTNERYTPRLMSEERDFAVRSMTSYLENSSDAQRFNQFQKQAMAQQTANVYLDVVRRFHLNITDAQRQVLLEKHLPVYAFCIGDSLAFVANNHKEEKHLLEFFKTGDKSQISAKLLQDVNTINTPCLAALNERVGYMFGVEN